MKKVLLAVTMIIIVFLTACSNDDYFSNKTNNSKREIEDFLYGVTTELEGFTSYDFSSRDYAILSHTEITKDEIMNTEWLSIKTRYHPVSEFSNILGAVRECDSFIEDEYCLSEDSDSELLVRIEDDKLLVQGNIYVGGETYNSITAYAEYIDEKLQVQIVAIEYNYTNKEIISYYMKNIYEDDYFEYIEYKVDKNITYEYTDLNNWTFFDYYNNLKNNSHEFEFIDEENQFGYSNQNNNIDYSLSFYSNNKITLIENKLLDGTSETYWNVLTLYGWETLNPQSSGNYFLGDEYRDLNNVIEPAGRQYNDYRGLFIEFQSASLQNHFSIFDDHNLSSNLTLEKYNYINENIDELIDDVVSSYGFSDDSESNIDLIMKFFDQKIDLSTLINFIERHQEE